MGKIKVARKDSNLAKIIFDIHKKTKRKNMYQYERAITFKL